MTAPQQPVGRVRFMDRQRVNLDGFAVENPELGLAALRSPHDPPPSLVITDGRVTELDGVPEADFDSIDTYIARHGLDLDVAEEVMGLSDIGFARLLVDPAVPRHEIIRLSAGASPAKLARALALRRPPRLGSGLNKVRRPRFAPRPPPPNSAWPCLSCAPAGPRRTKRTSLTASTTRCCWRRTRRPR